MQPCLLPLQRFLFPFLVVLCSFSPPWSYMSPFTLPQLLTPPLSISFPRPCHSLFMGLCAGAGAERWSCEQGWRCHHAECLWGRMPAVLPAAGHPQDPGWWGGEAQASTVPAGKAAASQGCHSTLRWFTAPIPLCSKGRSHMPLPHGTYLIQPPLLPVLSPHLPAPLCSPGFKLFAHSLSQLLPVTFKPIEQFQGIGRDRDAVQGSTVSDAINF